MRRDRVALIVLALAALALAVRLQGILGQSLWGDEDFTRNIVSVPWKDMLRRLPSTESNPSGQAIVASGGSSALPLGHYIGSGGVPPNIVIKATEVIAVGPEAPHGRRNCENGPLCNIGTAHPLAATIPGLRLVERRDTGRWHLARYRAAKPVTLDPAVADRFFDVPRLPQRFRHGSPARAR